MVIEEISDETSYSISERKFYVQSVKLKLMAYLIEPEDFEVKKFPKRVNTILNGDNFRKKVCVEIEEEDNPIENKNLKLNITFEPFHTKTEFDFDTDMTVTEISSENVRNIRVMINDELYYTEKTFKIKNNDNVRIQIKPIDFEKECKVSFIGYEDDVFYDSKTLPEKVFDEEITHEEINVE